MEEEDIIPKKRRVIYDEHTNSFYPETYMESLNRQCLYRSKMADVQNRCVEAKLTFVNKKVDTEKRIYLIKDDKEVTTDRENLKDHKAFIKVLGNILKEKNIPDFGGKYGRYGLGCSKTDLEPLIQHQRYEMMPEVIRKRQAELLLSKRKKMELIDRKMSTSAILDRIAKRRAAAVKALSPSPTPRTPSPEEWRVTESKTPKLILPPITVSKSREGRLSRQSTVPTPTINSNMQDSIFLTENE